MGLFCRARDVTLFNWIKVQPEKQKVAEKEHKGRLETKQTGGFGYVCWETGPASQEWIVLIST